VNGQLLTGKATAIKGGHLSAVHTFALKANALYTLEVNSSAVDPVIYLDDRNINPLDYTTVRRYRSVVRPFGLYAPVQQLGMHQLSVQPFADGNYRVTVTTNQPRQQGAYTLSVLPGPGGPRGPVVVQLPTPRCTPPVVERFKEVLASHPGTTEVHLQLVSGPKATVVKLDDRLRVTATPSLFADLKALLGPGCLPVGG